MTHTSPAEPRADHRPSLQRWWSQLCAVTLLIGTLAVASAPSATAAETAITHGTVTWGVKASWRNYIGESGIAVASGVTRAADGAFVWPVESGSYDDVTKELLLELGGSVHFSAHEGALDMTISQPRLVIEGDESQLIAHVVSKSETTGDMVDFGEIPLVNLDLTTGAPTTTDGSTAWTPLDARLTAEGYEAFSRNYGANTLVDSVSTTYVGPGGKPAITAENFLPPRSLVYEQSGTHPITGATSVLPDKDNGIVHVATGTTLRAYDYTTMEPLGDAIAFVGNSYPAPVLHDTSGAIFANTGGEAKAYFWNPTTKTYDAQVLNATAMTQFTAGATASQMYGFNGTGIYRWVYQSATKTFTKTEYPLSGLPTGRVGFAAVNQGAMIFAEASIKPFSVSIAGGLASRTPLPDDYANPNGQFGFNYPTEVQVISTTEFVLTNYQGQIMRAQSFAGGFARIGSIIDTGLNGVLRSTIDRTTGTAYFVDYAGQTIAAVKGSAYGLITVKDLGADVMQTLPVGANDGVLFASASRTGGSGDNYGIRRYAFLGTSPAVTTQPQDALATLQTGQLTDDVSFAVDGELQESIQWQTRPGAFGTFVDLAGATATKLDVAASVTDEGREYRAVLRNALGASVSDTATLTVHAAPAVVIDPTNQSVTDGGDALFEVMPSGNPYPSITWQRRINGFWTNISADDTNYRIDGGKLTVRSTNLEQTGTLFRAELRNVVDTIASKAARLTVSEPSTAVRKISAGDLDWGVKKSFREYVVGPIAHGTIATSDGASSNDDGTFGFTAGAGTWDPTTKTLAVDYDGTVTFAGHNGLLGLTISDPELVVVDGKGTLEAAVTSKDLESGTVKDHGRIDVADVVAPKITVGGDSVTVAAATTVLTAQGAPAFGGFYTAGTALDPLNSALTLGDVVEGTPATPVTPPAAGPARLRPTLSAKLSKSSVKAGQRARLNVVVTLPAAAGRRPTGQLVVRDGSRVIAVRTLKASHRGRVTVALPKLAKGRHRVKVTLNGTTLQEARTSPYRILRVR
ncbi:MAG: HtaA domain-containing protein [Aeromicrobium sp.]